VVTTWLLIVLMTGGAWWWARTAQRGARRAERAALPPLSRAQALLETLVLGLLEQIEEVTHRNARPMLPLLGTLFLFLVAANLIGLVPGMASPTASLETPAALATVVFFAVHVIGVRTQGLRGYLASFTQPKLIMLPLNLISEFTRTFSLMIRLFANVMSGEFVIALAISLAGLFVPIPLMALEALLGVVQAYVFTVLAAVFMAAAMGEGEVPSAGDSHP